MEAKVAKRYAPPMAISAVSGDQVVPTNAEKIDSLSLFLFTVEGSHSSILLGFRDIEFFSLKEC